MYVLEERIVIARLRNANVPVEVYWLRTCRAVAPCVTTKVRYTIVTGNGVCVVQGLNSFIVSVNKYAQMVACGILTILGVIALEGKSIMMDVKCVFRNVDQIKYLLTLITTRAAYAHRGSVSRTVDAGKSLKTVTVMRTKN